MTILPSRNGRWVFVGLLTLILAGARPAWAQTPAPATPAPQTAEARRAEAYYQFVMAQQLASEGDVAGAIAAYHKAEEFDPKSGAIPAQLADLYMQQGRIREAIDTAKGALTLDPTSIDAHRVLGLVYAALAQNGGSGAEADTAKAIAELEQAQPPRGLLPNPDTQITLARLYVGGGQYDKAIPLLKNLISQEPGWVAPVRLLIDAYVGAGRQKDAVTALEGAVQLSPSLNLPLADLAARTGQWAVAADAYGRAVAGNPKSMELRLRWASALLNVPDDGGVKQAGEILTEALADSPSDPNVLYLSADADRRADRFIPAEAAAKKLIDLEPGSLRGDYALVQVYEDEHQYQKVVDALEPLLIGMAVPTAQHDQFGLLMLHLAFAYEQLQNWDKAIATFDQARPYAPKGVILDLYIAQVDMAAKRYQAAADLAGKVRAAHPDDVRAAAIEAEALRHTGKFDQGVALLQESLKQHPDEPRAYIALGQLYADGGQADRGVTLLKEAAVRFPKNTDILFTLGTIYDTRKQYADAEGTFQQVLTVDPRNAPALNYLGYMLADRGTRLDESIGYLKRALAIDPDNGAYLDSLGWAYFKQQKLDLAEANLRRAAGQLTTNSVVQDHYGQLLFKLGRYADAIAAWKRSLSGDGESITRSVIEQRIKTAERKLGRK
ncbi:MAG TPA: tetratricopeptide repeat protein [Vicinamibacterales bacterium]|nr:tetratricopeptide repeat protein [Vicinamibacterales bacterium]